MSILLRRYDEARDAALLRRGIVLLQETERACDPRLPEGTAMVDAYLKEMRRLLDEWRGKVRVAEVDGEPAGFTVLYLRVPPDGPDEPPGTYALLSDLAVVPEMRGRGVARALLRDAERITAEAGAPVLRLEVMAGNEPAVRLYRSAGWRTRLLQMEIDPRLPAASRADRLSTYDRDDDATETTEDEGTMEKLTIYLAGEIHSAWRDELRGELERRGLDVELVGPQEEHDRSDAVGEDILGEQPGGRFRDLMGARVNTLRTRVLLRRADLVVASFGEKYRQWNTAADAGAAVAMGLPLVLVRPAELTHALKELDAMATLTVETLPQAAEAIAYVFE